ncbi:MAG: hypothetical protein AB7U82_28015 [Blastocatellales bacterium]
MPSQVDSSIPTRLLKAVAAKTFVEIILVCVVATLAAFSTFSPQLRGAIDVADQTRVAGWANDPESPEDALEVQLFIDGKPVASKLADERRIDLVEAGATSNPNRGFNFDLTLINLSPGRHTAQVYALRQAAGANKILLPIAQQPNVFEVNR